MKSKLREQDGFTLVELLIAVAISALIIVGSLAFLAYTTTVANDNRNKTEASLEVQYVGFWISEDVMQAGNVSVGNTTNGFPLVVEWYDAARGQQHKVTYTLVERGELYELIREKEVNGVVLGETSVGQHLVGVGIDSYDVDMDGNTTEQEWLTGCYRHQFEFVSSLILNVTADFYGKVATNRYEIHPRTFSHWTETDRVIQG